MDHHQSAVTSNTHLRLAAELIEKEGWRQGAHGKGICAAEAVGRVTVALYGYEDFSPLSHNKAAMDELRRRIGSPGVAQWNDGPYRTKEEVLEVLRGQNSL